MFKILAESMDEEPNSIGSREEKLRTILWKIRRNDTFRGMASITKVNEHTLAGIFNRNIESLAAACKQFIFWPHPKLAEVNTLLAFKASFANTRCIGDAFEIPIEKPRNSKKQAATYSQYKGCNTIKYLILGMF
jgi:hypothetical protein